MFKRNREEDESELYNQEQQQCNIKKNRIYQHLNTTTHNYAQQLPNEGEYNTNQDYSMQEDTEMELEIEDDLSDEGTDNCFVSHQEVTSYPWRGSNASTLADRRISTVSLNSLSSTYSSCPPTPSDFHDQFAQQQYQQQLLFHQQQQQQQQQYPTENNPTSFLNQNTYSPNSISQSLPLSVYPPTNYAQQQQQQAQQNQFSQEQFGKSLVLDTEASAFAAYALADIGRRATEGVIRIQSPSGMHQEIDA